MIAESVSVSNLCEHSWIMHYEVMKSAEFKLGMGVGEAMLIPPSAD